MRLINQTKNITLAENIVIASTIFARLKGLLGNKALLPNQALILDPCNAVHTFFMRFPIDVIFVDKEYRVIKVISNLNPNRVSPTYWHASKVVELPAGKLVVANIEVNDQLKILD